MTLLGPNGRPITTNFKKAEAPTLGPSFGDWAGRDVSFAQMPGSAILQFDLERLTLQDYRAMRQHPQINASLCVLAFMMHQLDWRIEAPTKKMRDSIESNMRETWSRMIRGMSQAFWAGYSPMVMEYENDLNSKQVVVTKFKDLIPEECSVNWKLVDGAHGPNETPPKLKVYDGIKHIGGSTLGINGTVISRNGRHIPVENTFWYPLLMENGDFGGRKLLKPAFPSWYFSILIHLFANRYYERFGEPTPIGRAPLDEQISTGDPNKPNISGKDAMENMLMNLRNHGVVTLPNDRIPGENGIGQWEWTIEYLESQMRGADFERYLSRLDEEMSLGIFTPILLFKTGDTGSHNLGVQQAQTFFFMLNAIAGDLKEYIDRYVVQRLRDFNFGPNAGHVEWKFRAMGKENVETMRAVIQALLSAGKASVDVEELGQIIGLTVKEVQEVTTDPTADPNADPNAPAKPDARVRIKPKSTGPRGVGQPRATGRQISNRVRSQVVRAFQRNQFGPEFKVDLGYARRFEEALKLEGYDDEDAALVTADFYKRLESWVTDAASLGADEYAGPQDFMAMFDRLIDAEVDGLAETA